MLTHHSPGRKHCPYAAVNSGDLLIKHRIKPGTLAHTYNLTTAEAQALPSLRPACDSKIIIIIIISFLTAIFPAQLAADRSGIASRVQLCAHG